MNITTHFPSYAEDSTHFLPPQNSDDLLSEKAYRIINDAFNGYITLMISLVGLPANFVTCLVFWRQGLRDRMNLCLFCLAAVDFLYVLPVTTAGTFFRMANSEVGERYYLEILSGSVGVKYGLRSISGCYNMIISLERCMCVVFPLRTSTLLSTRAMGVLLATCFVSVQLGYLVMPFEVRVVSIAVGGTVQLRYEPTQTYLDNKKLFDTIEMSILTVSLPIITFIVVSVTAVITVIKLTAALKWREKTSSACSDKVGQQTALTKMILLVSFIYICTSVPVVSLTITRLTVREFSGSGRYYYLFMATHLIANMCPPLHSASNFFVYYSRSSRFRSVLFRMCCCRSGTKKRSEVRS